ncbi:UNKNOWN [Stylonychia lemnae]|uniref:Uncharacterized protein n=1 Tax=Stylonychia lemnae TaxID=5949 RepID=A0A078B6L8_STYLE|nr:UNKNOWN [Stylonychia lemnae]|eukprot:CDW90180.1 UNKNOWN [Stylonychia lemnae]
MEMLIKLLIAFTNSVSDSQAIEYSLIFVINLALLGQLILRLSRTHQQMQFLSALVLYTAQENEQLKALVKGYTSNSKSSPKKLESMSLDLSNITFGGLKRQNTIVKKQRLQKLELIKVESHKQSEMKKLESVKQQESAEKIYRLGSIQLDQIRFENQNISKNIH